MKHIISFSGGLGSWMAARRVAAKYGTDNLYLVFADTLMEDADLYRFLKEAAADIGGELVWLKDGRNPWQVFRDVKYMGNTRIAHCSKELKSKVFEKWLKEQDFEDFIVYLGIDWTEEHRLITHRKYVKHQVEAPLCSRPFLSQQQMRDELAKSGIELPLMYKQGFTHNNCGGACVKAGQGQWAKVLELRPKIYAEQERQQNDLMLELPKTKPFLRKTEGGKLRYLTLTEFRKGLENGKQVDAFDIGGCGCFMQDGDV